MNDYYFVPGAYLLSLDEGRERIGYQQQNSQWQASWFPFTTSGGGDYYCVDHAQNGSVVHYFRGEPEHPVKYQSLTAMMRTAAECYQSGAYSITEKGLFEADAAAAAEIARRHNPEVDYWQDE